MESFLKNPFQNPFGGAMNPSGGGGGVLEQIQEQVNTNGETLQSLQGGIGGLPSGNFPFGGVPQPIMERPGPTVPEGIFQNPIQGMPGENLTSIDNEAFNPRDPNPFMRPENMMSSPINYLAGTQDYSGMTFEQAQRRMIQQDVKSPQEQAAIEAAIAGGPTGIFGANGVQGTINATAPIQGMFEPVDPGRNPSFYDPRGISNDEDRIQYGNVGNTRLAGPLDQYGVAQDPSIGKDLFNIRAPVGMDQLFGRAFAGKPV